MMKNLFPAVLTTALLWTALSVDVQAGVVSQKGVRFMQFAQADPPKADAPVGPTEGAQPLQAVQLKAVVVAVKGNVQGRHGEDQKWNALKAGDVLGPGAEIRTSINSAVQLHIDPGHTITIDRVTTVKLINLQKDKNGVKTDVGMKYGRSRYDVEAGGAVHDAKIHTPGTTLAIRGTWTGVQSDVFTESSWVIKGAVDNTNKLRREMVRIDSSSGKAVVTSDLVTPAAFAKNKAKNDTKGEFAGRQLTDSQVIEQYASGELDDRQAGVDETQKFARQEGFQFAGVGVFGDVFDLDLFWFPAETAADLDLIISDPLGGVLDPKGTTVVRAGQSTQGAFTGSPIDDDGSLGSGFETAQFGPQVPTGTFLVTIKHISGDDASGFLDARLQSTNGLFGTGNFDVSAASPQAQFLVNPQAQTIIPVGGGG